MSIEIIAIICGLVLWFLVGLLFFLTAKEPDRESKKTHAVIVMLVPCGFLVFAALTVAVEKQSSSYRDQVSTESKIEKTVESCKKFIEVYETP
jgi:NADH:ubiquinone oxidoreductase subunit 5 (subunit L)/multisubunit Na+/H+ antiporter MnhA subunit